MMLRELGALLDAQAATYRVKAFRNAAEVVAGTPRGELLGRAREGTLERLKGLGPKTARVVAEALDGRTPSYLAALEKEAAAPLTENGGELLAAQRAGVTTVFIPARNEPDLDDVPAEVLEALTVHPVSDVAQILAQALEPAATAVDAAAVVSAA